MHGRARGHVRVAVSVDADTALHGRGVNPRVDTAARPSQAETKAGRNAAFRAQREAQLDAAKYKDVW